MNYTRIIVSPCLGQLFCPALMTCLIPWPAVARSNCDCMGSHENKNLTDPLPPRVVIAMRLFGAATILGLSLMLLVIYAGVFGYR